MILFLVGLAFAEEEKKQEVNKEKRLRIGVCGGFAHCPFLGVEISYPQITPHLGTKAAWGPFGNGGAITYSFNTDNRRYDPYVSFAYTYVDFETVEALPVSLNYGAYWRLGKKIPIFLDFQIGAGADVVEGVATASFSVSVLGGFF